MENLLINNGLPALFVLSFLAATIIPIGSEWLLVTLVLRAYDLESAVAVASCGNYLGACTTYLIGMYGSTFLVEKVVRIDHKTLSKSEYYFSRYGSWTLLFSWLPIIGDSMCLVGGMLRLNFMVFSLLVFSGKLARYAFVAYVAANTL